MAKPKREDTRRVELQSGGTVAVTLDCSVFDLSGRDREFVTTIVDLIRDYEGRSKTRTKSEAAAKPASKPARGKGRTARGKTEETAPETADTADTADTAA